MTDDKGKRIVAGHCPICDTRITISAKHIPFSSQQICKKCGAIYEITVSSNTFIHHLISTKADRKAVPV